MANDPGGWLPSCGYSPGSCLPDGTRSLRAEISESRSSRFHQASNMRLWRA
jgi:hypothetical protein